MYIITGQTATGKTSYAQELASKYSGEIINCDSRQIYKKLNIITGKDIPNQSEYIHVDTQNTFDIGYYTIRLQANNIKLWLYDVVDPHNYFSSYDYVQCAASVIEKVKKESKVPIFTGGTYLYIKHLLYGIPTDAIPPNFTLRKALEKLTVNKLQSKLQKISAQTFTRLNHSDVNNPRRLIRHIEIASAPQSNSNKSKANKIDMEDIKVIGFRFSSKDTLIKHIHDRVEKRLKQGAIEEVEVLLQLGYNENDPGLKTIGYKSIIKYLQNTITKEDAINEWITNEIQYAKRQLTFMKTDSHIEWKEIQ